MNKEQLRELAEAHFDYTKGVIERSAEKDLSFDTMIMLCEYLYTEAMIHGYKHCKDEVLSVIDTHQILSGKELSEELEWIKKN